MIRLEQVHIPSPCSQSWDAMTGDEQARFCEHCQKSVYNLSEMTRPEAERLVTRMNGHLCARMEVRADGSIIMREAPPKVAMARRGGFSNVSYAVALLLSVCTGFVQSGGKADAAPAVRHSQAEKYAKPAPKLADEDIPPPPKAPVPDLLSLPPSAPVLKTSPAPVIVTTVGVAAIVLPSRPRPRWWLRFSWPIRVGEIAKPGMRAAARERTKAPGRRQSEG